MRNKGSGYGLPTRIFVGIKLPVVAFLFCMVFLLGCAYALAPPVSALATGSVTSPPAHICGNASILTSPYTTQPYGSVAINSSDIGTMIQNSPAYTTFWLESGTYYTSIASLKNGDTLIGAPNVIIDGEHIYGDALSAPAGQTNITLEYLTVENFGAPISPSSFDDVDQNFNPFWTYKYDTFINDQGAAIGFDYGGVIEYDCLTQNGGYGFNSGGGVNTGGVNGNIPGFLSTNTTSTVADAEKMPPIKLEHDEISFNNVDNIDRTPFACGCSGGGKLNNDFNVTISDNYMHNNYGPGIWSDGNNDEENFSNNYIMNNWGIGIDYELGVNAKIWHNTLIGNEQVDGTSSAGFMGPAIYISNAGGSRVAGNLYYEFNITNNTFLDNYGGIALWEDGSRFCGNSRPGNSCNQDAFAVGLNSSTCTVSAIENATPGNLLWWACMWRTQNVTVANNYFLFNFTQSECGLGLAPVHIGCGIMGLFSGVVGEPYGGAAGYGAEDNITYYQNNHFNNNTYVGNWLFSPYGQGQDANFSMWQGKTAWSPDEGGALEGQHVNQDQNSVIIGQYSLDG